MCTSALPATIAASKASRPSASTVWPRHTRRKCNACSLKRGKKARAPLCAAQLPPLHSNTCPASTCHRYASRRYHKVRFIAIMSASLTLPLIYLLRKASSLLKKLVPALGCTACGRRLTAFWSKAELCMSPNSFASPSVVCARALARCRASRRLCNSCRRMQSSAVEHTVLKGCKKSCSQHVEDPAVDKRLHAGPRHVLMWQGLPCCALS